MAAPQTPLNDDELTSAIELLHRLIPKEDFPAYSLEVSPATVYTHLVTLWMLTLQRPRWRQIDGSHRQGSDHDQPELAARQQTGPRRNPL